MKLNSKIKSDLSRRYNLEEDVVDWNRWDSNLTYQENLTVFDGLYFKGLEYSKDENGHFDQEMSKLEEEHIEAVRKEKIDELRKELKDSPIDNFYQPLYDGVLKQKLGLRNLLFIKGRAGVGKSYHIKRALIKNNMEFVTIRGRITEAHLYQTLYENQGKVIHFADVMRLFRGLESIEMLKAICETEKEDRVVSNNTYSKEINHLPKSFIFKGSVIFDFNQIVDLRYSDDFNALVSRGELIELAFSFEEISQIMREIAKTSEEKEVTEFLIENYRFIGNNQFNLRTQQDAFIEFKFASAVNRDWKIHLKDWLNKNMSPLRTYLYQFLGKTMMKAVDLKKALLLSGQVMTVRSASRRIEEWVEIGELFRVSSDIRNPMLSLYPMIIEDTRDKIGVI